MLSGTAPYADRTDALSVMVSVVREPLPPLGFPTPAWLAAVVAKATAKHPDERYQSAEAFTAALDAGGSRRGVSAIVGRQTCVISGRARVWCGSGRSGWGQSCSRDGAIGDGRRGETRLSPRQRRCPPPRSSDRRLTRPTPGPIGHRERTIRAQPAMRPRHRKWPAA